MAATLISNMVSPNIWSEIIQASFPNALSKVYDTLVASGALVENSGLEAQELGKVVEIPYICNVPAFETISTDGSTPTLNNSGSWSETASIGHYALNLGISDWARRVKSSGPEVLKSLGNQIALRTKEKLSDMVLTAASSTTNLGQVATSTSTLNYSLLDGYLAQMGDSVGLEFDNVACVITHPKALMDLSITGNSPSVSYFKTSIAETYKFPFLGYEGMKSSPAMGAVAASGTTPPTLTLTGTPNDNGRRINLVVNCTTLGALNTWVLKYSTDGGSTWITGVSSASTVALNYSSDSVLNQRTVSTGLTLNIASGTAAVDNVWTSNMTFNCQTMIVLKGALLAYWNKDVLAPQEFYNPQSATLSLTSHLYGLGYRYRSCQGTNRPGVFLINHA